MRSSAQSQLKIKEKYRKETHTHPSTPNVARPTGPKDVWLHLLNLAFAQHITNRVREWHTPNELNDKDKNCNRQSNFADESSNSIQSNLQQKTHNMNQSCHIYSTRVLASNWGKNTDWNQIWKCSSVTKLKFTWRGVSSPLSWLIAAMTWPHSVCVPTPVTCSKNQMWRWVINVLLEQVRFTNCSKSVWSAQTSHQHSSLTILHFTSRQ